MNELQVNRPKLIQSVLLLFEHPLPITLLFLSGAICVNRTYSFLHLPLSGAIYVSALPPAIYHS